MNKQATEGKELALIRLKNEQCYLYTFYAEETFALRFLIISVVNQRRPFQMICGRRQERKKKLKWELTEMTWALFEDCSRIVHDYICLFSLVYIYKPFADLTLNR